ncbi:hypothetical protein F5Y15DRAFT_265599 [Xylariaceae sp. FL0016]|nr:hypothetical protein F5Y15DRAFT_265599 [Xylariaceae sp. FL0016]
MPGRPVAVAGCSICRSALLNIFTTSLRTTPLRRAALPQTALRPFPQPPVRCFSSFQRLDTASNQTKTSGRERQHVETQEYLDVNDRNAPESQSDEVPWYLQVDPPRHVAAMEPPPLPEIPVDSPPLIGALLEYAAEEMGLDDLKLLDLRELDPPPALGANLFMFFGTARTERHLNVSAGRLVRWLRTQHRIYADADGLLGPNERKLKLRRKARKAKLLGTMGTDDADDGIRTGWICVNLGNVGRVSDEAPVVAEDGRVAGFGVAQSGSTVVFQIMTESRRAELGLETLWETALKPRRDQTAKLQDPIRRPTDNEDLHPLEKAIRSSNSHNISSSLTPSAGPAGTVGTRTRHQ